MTFGHYFKVAEYVLAMSWRGGKSRDFIIVFMDFPKCWVSGALSRKPEASDPKIISLYFIDTISALGHIFMIWIFDHLQAGSAQTDENDDDDNSNERWWFRVWWKRWAAMTTTLPPIKTGSYYQIIHVYGELTSRSHQVGRQFRFETVTCSMAARLDFDSHQSLDMLDGWYVAYDDVVLVWRIRS